MGSTKGAEGERVEDLDVEETVYVAVGKNIEKSRQILLWAVHNCAEKKICVLHVHRPEHVNTLSDRKLYENEPSDCALKAFQEKERQNVHELVDHYILTLALAGVQANKLLIEMDSIEKGIVQAIAQHNIRWLVMGAAADRYHSGPDTKESITGKQNFHLYGEVSDLAEEESKKAVLVLEQASVSCNIWFIYKGNLICTRRMCYNYNNGRRLENVSTRQTESEMEKNKTNCSTDNYNHSDCPYNEFSNFHLDFIHILTDRKHTSEIETAPSLVFSASMEGKQSEKFSSECTPSAQKYLDAENIEGMFRNFSSHCSLDSVKSNRSVYRVVDRSKSADLLFHEEESDERDEASEINGRLEQANTDVEDINIMEAQALESLYANETSRRRELEELLAREKKELQKLKNQRDEITCELKMTQDQNSALNSQVIESKTMVTELEEKIISAVELLISFREKRDNLRAEHADAVREVNKLRKFENIDAKYSYGTEFPTFSFIEINQATNDFDPSWKIGEGRYGSIYRGLLCNMQVAIKMLPSYGCQSEFQHQAPLDD
ncbi:U-box domain-containing protein 32 isoform X1 [Senna tora]|uniref:RING-type E3 ubiquitin transferase n=1 Tax=Senna tora TaxID=362788 RepID=A0A834WIC1_9FABA|nr:U-box domain-containing protein 32 isoform X1 [Senna tora]